MKHILLIGLAVLTSYQCLAAHRDSTVFKSSNTVSADMLYRSDEVNPVNALYGQLSGLYVMQNVDAYNVLDYQANMNIRGISTFGNAAPLILVDGIERSMGDLSTVEIEKIEVLKDAVSSAIYGIRGANGAVLVTTKRGSRGFRASVNYRTSFDTPFRLPEFVDAATYAELVNEASVNDGHAPRYSLTETDFFRNGTNAELYPDVDWQAMAYRNYGMKHQADIQFEGGTERFKYFTAVNYSHTEGLLNHTDMFSQYDSQLTRAQLNVRANIDAKITRSTFLRVNLLARIKEQKRPGTGVPTIIQRLYDTPSAAFPVMTGTGKWGGTNIYQYNPIADFADKGIVKAVRRTLMADITLKQELDFITKGLYAEVTAAYDNMANYSDQRTRNYEYEMLTPVFNSDGTLNGCYRTPLGLKSELGWNSTLNNLEMYSTLYGRIGYTRIFGEHAVDGKIVYEQLVRIRNGRNATAKRQSIMAIASYSYAGKYFADAVVNYSGSAVLPEGKKFNIYPAASFAYLISNEDFMKGNSVVTHLKLKASAGLSGSDLFGHDLDIQSFGVNGNSYWFGDSNSISSTGLKEGALPVAVLLAECSRKADAGIELSLWNRIHMEATYFNERRSNILVDGDPVISSVIGIGIPSLCEGIVENQGIEIGLNIGDRIGDFSYNLNGNFTFARNKIIENNEGFQPYSYLSQKGHSLNAHYGLVSDGFYNSQEEIDNAAVIPNFGKVIPGDIRYKDQNGDNIINEYDVVNLGYGSLPEIYYGFNINIAYAGFSICAQFQGVANRNIYLNTSSVFMPLKNNTNISTWYTEHNVRWTPETADKANLPRLTTEANPNNFQKSAVWLRNGNFIKLRNLEVAYTFSREMLKVMDMKLFVRGTNLFSVDELKYADPENYGANYPTMRSFSVGIDFKF